MTGPETLEMVLEDYWKVGKRHLENLKSYLTLNLSEKLTFFQVTKPMELFYEFEVRDVNN